MHTPHRKRTDREATPIECLACGARRIVPGLGTAEPGECPRCGYLGWTYSDELDSSTCRMIMKAAFAGRAFAGHGIAQRRRSR
jgi:uncharacterized paraquat-inducible protein A